MSIGNFNETNDSSNEVKETNESTDNTEKPRNQILETPDSYEDDFGSKLDSAENDESNNENSDNTESKSGETGGEEKKSLLDRMRNIFSHKEHGSELNETTEEPDKKIDNTDFSSKKKSFEESLREGVPSLEQQAENAKKWKESSNESGADSDDAKMHGEDGQRTPFSDMER